MKLTFENTSTVCKLKLASDVFNSQSTFINQGSMRPVQVFI